MVGGITYQGAASNEGGNIFDGVKFWVARRVPTRVHILDLIESNGGVVVSREKDAHMLIADHIIKKHAPADSISWEYITDSVKHGIAQLTDHYRIWSHTESPSRTAGRSAPLKRTRTPFSHADDAVLANYVLSFSSDRTGNHLYKAFAVEHHWHTWQAWRNRFVKNLAHRSVEDLQKLALSAPELAVQHSSKSSHVGSDQPTPGPSRDHESRPAKNAGRGRVAATGSRPTRNTRSRAAALTPVPASVTDHGTGDGGSPTREVKPEIPPTEASPSRSEDAGVETQHYMEKRFYDDLRAFRGTDLNGDIDPKFGNTTVNLWDLSQAVSAQNVSLDQVDWLQVLEDLNLASEDIPDGAESLYQCYQDHLADFFEFMSRLSPIPSGESIIRSSPPVSVTSPRKRRQEHNVLSLTEQSSKRPRRLSRSAEIPSTPDEKLRPGIVPSPSVQEPLGPPYGEEGSTSKDTGDAELPTAVDEDDDRMIDETLPEMHQSAGRPLLEACQSAPDVTPTQQILSEALDATPIPLDLRQPRAESGGQNAAAAADASKTRKRRTLPASFELAAGRAWTPRAARRAAQQLSRLVGAEVTGRPDSSDVRECVEYYESLGYARSTVMKALACTSLTPGWPASEVMERLQAKQGVPDDIEGVWTDGDDERLRFADAVAARKSSATAKELRKAKRELTRVVDKHTQRGVDLRRQFLA